jgi:hypothetical protein
MLKTVWSLLRNNFTLRPSQIAFLLRHALTLWLLNVETKAAFAKHYGDFHRDRDLRPHRLLNPTSEGGAIIGDVVWFAKTVEVGDGDVLFAGDRNDVKPIWSTAWSPPLPLQQMLTCGLHGMDLQWNFEEPLPEALATRRFRLIVSQAMIEHLVDPWRHVRDLASLLDRDGVLVLHSVLPGFFYHRVPIDCMRFYPDWFESIADRFGLEIVDRQISVFHLTYKYRRP